MQVFFLISRAKYIPWLSWFWNALKHSVATTTHLNNFLNTCCETIAIHINSFCGRATFVPASNCSLKALPSGTTPCSQQLSADSAQNTFFWKADHRNNRRGSSPSRAATPGPLRHSRLSKLLSQAARPVQKIPARAASFRKQEPA